MMNCITPGIDFIWENLDTQEREQRKFAIRTVLSTQYLRDYLESVLKSANTLWLLRYKPEDIPVLRDNFNVPEFMLKRFLKMPEGRHQMVVVFLFWEYSG